MTVKTDYASTRTVKRDDITAILTSAEWRSRNPAAAAKTVLVFEVGGGIEIDTRNGVKRYEIVGTARGRVTVKEGRGTRTYKHLVVQRTFSPSEWQALQSQLLAS